MKFENLRRWTIHIRHLSDVPVSRNWYKTVSNLYENSFICNLNKSFNIQQICNQSENDDIPQKRKNLRFAFYLYFLIDIIDNIITYSPYSPYYVTRTSANGSAASLSRDTDKNHVTSVLYRFWFHSIAPLYFSFTVPLICSFEKKYDDMIRCEYHKKNCLV